MNLRDQKTVAQRRETLESLLKLKFPNIGKFSLDEKIASSKNCENMIGVAQIPLGVAGPLKILGGANIRGEYYIPLATTEGALVASVNRGCKAITESGGADVNSHQIGATRGPVFRVKDLEENKKMYAYLKEHFEELKLVAEKTSNHLTLKKYSTSGVGRYRYVRFVFDTQDAMGLNMVTIATNAIVDHIKSEIGISCLALSGNFCTDKKPSWQNFINNRGIKVWAEVVLTKKVLTDVLKTSAQKAYEVWLAKCMLGSAMSGSMAFNAQFANVIAAIFIATGQDAAHVVEGSLGITTAEVMGEDLYVSVYLPDLMVGTVGGGTNLATQNEALNMLGVAGGNEGKNAKQFAEIIGASVLAGEISLLSSLGEGTLARAHQVLGRGEK